MPFDPDGRFAHEGATGTSSLARGSMGRSSSPAARAQLADHRVDPVDELLDVAASRAGQYRPRQALTGGPAQDRKSPIQGHLNLSTVTRP
jgi:hypothetical protein